MKSSNLVLFQAERHNWVVDYNWDNGLAPIWRIVRSPLTEFATALLIYWRLDGPWLQAEPDSANWEAMQLQDLVRDQIVNGFYSVGSSVFNPRDEFSEVDLFRFRKAGVPDLLLGSEGND